MRDSDYPEQPMDGVRTHEIGSRTYLVADVDPLDVDGTRTVAVGTALFGLAFLALLSFHSRLEDTGRAWWVWSALAGFALGVVGWDYCRRRRRRRHQQPGTQGAPALRSGRVGTREPGHRPAG